MPQQTVGMTFSSLTHILIMEDYDATSDQYSPPRHPTCDWHP